MDLPLGLCEGVRVYVHDILCMTMLSVTTPRIAPKSRFVMSVSRLVVARPFPLRLWEGRDTVGLRQSTTFP